MTKAAAGGANPINQVKFIDKYDRVALRNGIVAAFYFDKPPQVIAPEISLILDAYMAAIPAGVLKYSVTSASAGQFKPFGPGTIAECHKQLNPKRVAKRELTGILLNSGGAQASQYEFHFVAPRPDRGEPEAASVLKMIFPVDVVARGREQEFVDRVREISESMDYLCGHCSFSLVPMLSALGSVTSKELRRLALRHPGYDLPSNRGTSFFLGQRVRGASWITWLGPGLTALLGGIFALRKQLREPIELEELTKGVMIRAGLVPELGDVNRKISTPLLRKVAAVLEPITFFGDHYAMLYQTFGDEDLLRRWERRFLDTPGVP